MGDRFRVLRGHRGAGQERRHRLSAQPLPGQRRLPRCRRQPHRRPAAKGRPVRRHHRLGQGPRRQQQPLADLRPEQHRPLRRPRPLQRHRPAVEHLRRPRRLPGSQRGQHPHRRPQRRRHQRLRQPRQRQRHLLEDPARHLTDPVEGTGSSVSVGRLPRVSAGYEVHEHPPRSFASSSATRRTRAHRSVGCLPARVSSVS
ncbi:hypothetical protein SGPA1_40675 [Streptomyces misionensis JCM 4497]